MKEIKLEKLFKINGLGAASGLVYENGIIYAIGDNSSFLYAFDEKKRELEKFPLIDNAQEQTIKSEKLDFEALTKQDNQLYIFGSGSTKNRNKMVQFDIQLNKITATLDLTNLYEKMQEIAKINPDEFNIEGVTRNNQDWYFFNRGNSIHQRNVVFSLKANDLSSIENLAYHEFQLPKIEGVTTSFTDALYLNNQLYFLAAAENTLSTYDDGEVLGSTLGSIDVATMTLDFTIQITHKNKFEGLTLYKQNPKEITFLLCEDTDTDVQESWIYILNLKHKR
jgi:hypothetical protein